LLLPGNEQLQQSKMPKLPDYDAGFATAVLERGGKMSVFKPLHHDLHLN
jgi:NTE family protein